MTEHSERNRSAENDRGAPADGSGGDDGSFGMELPDSVVSESVWARVTVFQLVYSLFGLALGGLCVIAGVYLFLRGVTGASSMTAKMLGAETSINDAAPGAVLFVVGLLITWVTRFFVKVSRK